MFTFGSLNLQIDATPPPLRSAPARAMRALQKEQRFLRPRADPAACKRGAMMTATRRLAAIFAADVVGYGGG
jgi:hypothetical protein